MRGGFGRPFLVNRMNMYAIGLAVFATVMDIVIFVAIVRYMRKKDENEDVERN